MQKIRPDHIINNYQWKAK